MKTIMTSILFIQSFVLLTSSSFSQQDWMPHIKVESSYIGSSKVPTSMTNSVPSHISYATDGQNFKITVTMTFQDNYIFLDSLYGIVCIMPDRSAEKILFKPEDIIVYSSQQYGYSFPVRIKSDGWIEVYVARKSDMSSGTDAIFYQDTSNKESIYLQPEPK